MIFFWDDQVFKRQVQPPRRKLLFPALNYGELKTRQEPGTSFEASPIPVLAEPKKVIRILEQLRVHKTFASPDAANPPLARKTFSLILLTFSLMY